jgi:tetratricopeptide (TPR) repeat protein
MTETCFMRFRWNDAQALANEIAEAQEARNAAVAAQDIHAEVEATCRLGVALTAADREAEAAKLLTPTLAKARVLADPAPTAWTLLSLATARQYLGEHTEALAMFAEGLDIATRNGLRDVEHYLWHHRGRCHAELRDIAKARDCFERALKLRLELGDPRASRSREAIEMLEKL